MSMYTLLRNVFVILLIHECVCDGQRDRLAVRSGEPRTLLVTSIEGLPYLRRKSGTNGTNEFEGFIPDMLQALSRLAYFSYAIRLVGDGKYGAQDQDGTWNGMIGELLRGEADLAAAPLTVTSPRMRVIDFTYPFIGNNHLAALMKKRHAMQAEISSPRDLSRQSTIKYGTISSGSTREYFRMSKDSDYSRMWEEMNRNTDNFVLTMQEGADRVIGSSDEHPWAFLFSHSSSLEYYAGQRCDLEVIMDPYAPSGGTAMALPLGSTYYDRINIAVVEMIESEEMSSLRRKWWSTTDCHNSASRAFSPLHTLVRYLLQPLFQA